MFTRCQTRSFAAPVVLAVSMMAACAAPPAPGEPAAGARPVAAVPGSQPGLTTVTGKAPRGAVVALDSPAARAMPVPGTPAVVDQRGQQFLPTFLTARAGQAVEFRNSESIVHNVYVTRSPAGVEVLNVGTDPGQRHAHTFDEPGRYEVSCDIHPGMAASIVVVSTPYVAVGDDFGNFTILNVPPGEYELATSSEGRTTRRVVQVAGPHAAVGSAAGTP